MHGRFIWNELATTSIEQAKSFYAATLGWTFEPYALPDGEYWLAKSEGQVVGGIGGMDTASLPGATTSHWFSFIEVEDVDACLARALATGGGVISPATDVPTVGRVAVMRDPTGAAIGVLNVIRETGDAEG